MIDPFQNIDKNAFSVRSFSEPSDHLQYWISKTPEERIQAIEFQRRINYGEACITGRLQRVYEVVDLNENKKASGRHRDLDDLENLPE